MKLLLICNIFSISELNNLQASCELLHCFILWAISDSDSRDSILSAPGDIQFEPISGGSVAVAPAFAGSWLKTVTSYSRA